MRIAVFLDRDGVINRAIVKDGRPFSPRMIEDFEILPDIDKALNQFHELGYLNIVITNQPDISRGLMHEHILNEMHELIREELQLDDIFVCPHDDSDRCTCRKPKPGMILDAAVKWEIDLRNSFFVGDTWKDIEAGSAAGCSTVLIDRPYNKGLESDHRIWSLMQLTIIINKFKQ